MYERKEKKLIKNTINNNKFKIKKVINPRLSESGPHEHYVRKLD
jgi:hypothetical protein